MPSIDRAENSVALYVVLTTSERSDTPVALDTM